MLIAISFVPVFKKNLMKLLYAFMLHLRFAYKQALLVVLFSLYSIIFSIPLLAQQGMKVICGNTDPIPGSTQFFGDMPLGGVPTIGNGGVFTPNGDLRVLVVYAGFINTSLADNDPNQYGFQDAGNWPNKPATNASPATWAAWKKSVPEYVDANTGACPQLFFQNLTDFTTSSSTLNISNYYYTMSGGKFKMIGEVFKDPLPSSPTYKKPVRINIDLTPTYNSMR
jgi:hypothetical protein